MYKNILLTTDFSEGTAIVCKKTKMIAKTMKAKISLLHVVEPIPGYSFAFINDGEIEEQLVQSSKKQLKQLGKQLFVDETDQYITLGPTKVEIIRIAQKLKSDLIIIGSHGHHGLGRLLGSTANAVIHNASCDVLTIKIADPV